MRRRSLRLLVTPAIVAVMLLLCVGVSIAVYGSATNAIARIQGHVLGVDSYHQYLGQAVAGHKSPAYFSIRNLTGRTLRIIGAKVDCSCLVGNKLPLEIGPFETTRLEFALEPSNRSAGSFVQGAAELYFDVPSPPVVLTVSANVAPIDESASVDPN